MDHDKARDLVCDCWNPDGWNRWHVLPLSSLLTSHIFNNLLEHGGNFREAANFGAILNIGIAVVAFGSSFLQTYLLSVVGDTIVCTLRGKIFAKVMSMHIGFFDDPKNSAGSLTAALSNDTHLVKDLTGTLMGTQFQAASG